MSDPQLDEIQSWSCFAKTNTPHPAPEYWQPLPQEREKICADSWLKSFVSLRGKKTFVGLHVPSWLKNPSQSWLAMDYAPEYWQNGFLGLGSIRMICFARNAGCPFAYSCPIRGRRSSAPSVIRRGEKNLRGSSCHFMAKKPLRSAVNGFWERIPRIRFGKGDLFRKERGLSIRVFVPYSWKASFVDGHFRGSHQRQSTGGPLPKGEELHSPQRTRSIYSRIRATIGDGHHSWTAIFDADINPSGHGTHGVQTTRHLPAAKAVLVYKALSG